MWLTPLVRWSMRRRTRGAFADLDPWSGGSVILFGRDRVLLSFLIGPFVPWGGDAREQRESSGAADLVRSLGLVLEAATEDVLPARREARAALVDPQPNEEVYGRVCTALTVAAGVLAFLSWPYGGTVVGVLSSAAALGAIAPVLMLLVDHRRRFERLVGSPPDPGGDGLQAAEGERRGSAHSPPARRARRRAR